LRQEPQKREPPPGLVARLLDIGANQKTEGPPLEDMAKAVGKHLAHRLDPRTIGKEMFAAVTDRIIPQGAAELSQALFTGHAYSPYGYSLRPLQPEEPGHGVHGPEPSIEKRAAEFVALEGWRLA
jgi:hypothetical protein